MKSATKIKKLFQKNADGQRPLAVLFNEAVSCAKWLAAKNDQETLNGIEAAKVAGKAFLKRKFIMSIAMAALMGASAGSLLALRVSRGAVIHERFDATVADIKYGTGGQSKAKFENGFPWAEFADDFKKDLVKIYDNAAIGKYAARGALSMALLAVFTTFSAGIYANYKQATQKPDPVP